MTLHHLCFSGSSACSGVNPCVACAEVTGERVLPAATIAGGLNGSLLALVHLFAQALYQVEQRYRCGVDPANLALSKLGIPLSSVPGTPEDQARAFHAAYREAWGRLVQGLASDPRVVRTAVHDSEQSTVNSEQSVQVPLTEEQIRDLMRGAEASASQPQAAPEVPPAAPAAPPPAAQPSPPPSAEGYEAFLRKRAEAMSAVVTSAGVAASVSPTNTTPMDAEDIAAAAVAVDPATLPNGSIHS